MNAELVANEVLQWSNPQVSYPDIPLSEKEAALDQLFKSSKSLFQINVPYGTIMRGLDHRLNLTRKSWTQYSKELQRRDGVD